MEEKQWRFPDNNYGAETGLDTADIETFKRDPIAALAREICQNSIDAKLGNVPVKVEFKKFEINREDLPGIDKLTQEINNCYEFKKTTEKEEKPLRLMKEWINKKKINCLRISDYNTTGLLGVGTNKRDMPFYNLTKGTGVSAKNGTEGGSKGIGKFASFVSSEVNTVFYYSKTMDGEEGYLGIAKLRSTPLSEDGALMTAGIGYYGKGIKNEPVNESLQLDRNFSRSKDEFGTDVNIIGFDDKEGWQNDVIAKILDSFMAAILFKSLEVEVEDIVLNDNTIERLIKERKVFEGRSKREIIDIIAQFELISLSENVHKSDFIISENNKISIYVKKYNRGTEANANKRCIMVRHPYMKIKHMTGLSVLPFSALCIIHENKLNKLLRYIENPQHTDWEIKRLDGYPIEKKQTRQLKKEMEEKIREYIQEVLRSSASESTDVEGAGEFLPSEEFGEEVGEQTNDIVKRVSALNERKSESVSKDQINNEEISSMEMDTLDQGNSETEDATSQLDHDLDKRKDRKNEEPDSDSNQGILAKKTLLKGIKIRNIVVDKKKGLYDIVFRTISDEKDCELEVVRVGEGNDKYPLQIVEASISNKQCIVEKGKIIGLSLQKETKYTIKCRINIDKLFASEVRVYANRQ